MKCPALGLLTLAAIWALAEPARADSFPAWQKQTTDKGCLLYQYEESVGGMESDPQPVGYAWSGTCTPGQPINGEGTLYEQHNHSYSDGESDRWIRSSSGRLVGGLFDGKVRHRRHDVDARGSWNPATAHVEDPEHATSYYYKGCTDEMLDDGWGANDCQPGKVTDPIVIPRVAPAYFPLPEAGENAGDMAAAPIAPPEAPRTPASRPLLNDRPDRPSSTPARIDPAPDARNGLWNAIPSRKTAASGTRMLAESTNPAQRALRQQQAAGYAARQQQRHREQEMRSGTGSALFGALLQTAAAVAVAQSGSPDATLALNALAQSGNTDEANRRLMAGAVTALAGGDAQQVGQALSGQAITPSTPALQSSRAGSPSQRMSCTGANLTLGCLMEECGNWAAEKRRSNPGHTYGCHATTNSRGAACVNFRSSWVSDSSMRCVDGFGTAR